MSLMINAISAVGNNSSVYPLIVRDCVIEGPIKVAQNYNETAKECLTCSYQCLTCEGNSAQCTSCNTGTFLYNSDCLSQCPIGYYGNETNQCSKCSEDCYTCSDSPDTCTSCDESTFLYNGTCIDHCPN